MPILHGDEAHALVHSFLALPPSAIPSALFSNEDDIPGHVAWDALRESAALGPAGFPSPEKAGTITVSIRAARDGWREDRQVSCWLPT